MNQTPAALRKGLLIAAIISLLAGMWAGLLRLGTGWPVLHPALPMAHGPLMIAGFLGTLICLERAVAVGGRLAYIPPIATALGAVLVVARYGGWAGPFLITLGSAGLVLVMAALWKRHLTLYGATLVAGAAAWLGGNLLWLFGTPVPGVVIWWIGFMVLTIAGERLELSRLLRLSRDVQALFVACGALLSPWAVCCNPRLSSGHTGGGRGHDRLCPVAAALRHRLAPAEGRRSGAFRGGLSALRLCVARHWRRACRALRRRHGGSALRCDAAQHLRGLRVRHDLRPCAHRHSLPSFRRRSPINPGSMRT